MDWDKDPPGSAFLTVPHPAAVQISDWRRDHTWRPDDEEAPETYLAQRYVDGPYLVSGYGGQCMGAGQCGIMGAMPLT